MVPVEVLPEEDDEVGLLFVEIRAELKFSVSLLFVFKLNGYFVVYFSKASYVFNY